MIDDKELRHWYITKERGKSQGYEKLSNPALLRLAREALLQEVDIEQRKSIFARKTEDLVVGKLVKSYESTDFLMVSKF